MSDYKKTILHNSDKLEILHEVKVYNWRDINGTIYAWGEPMPDDADEARKWVKSHIKRFGPHWDGITDPTEPRSYHVY